MIKKVVAFCLWGDKPEYTIGAIENAKLVNEIYPKWEARFYIHENVNQKVRNDRRHHGVQIRIYKGHENHDGAFERFRPMCDKDVSLFVSRDCDSRLSDKEYQAVLEWENNDSFQFHSMKDHTNHQYPPVLGGMWGAKNYG